jgi:hypothetical protein
MNTSSEIAYYINEEGFVIKHYKDAGDFVFVHIEPKDSDYSEYEQWVEEGNQPTPIVGMPQKDIE